jgi:hypothetical protein
MRSDVVKRFFRIAWFEVETLLHLHLFPPDLLTFAQRALCALRYNVLRGLLAASESQKRKISPTFAALLGV